MGVTVFLTISGAHRPLEQATKAGAQNVILLLRSSSSSSSSSFPTSVPPPPPHFQTNTTMSAVARNRRPQDIVFQIPELMDVILGFLASRHIASLRIVCKSMHQHCYRWFHLVLDSARDFNDDDDNDDYDEHTADALPRPKQGQEDPSFIDSKKTGQQDALQRRWRRHKQGILTTTGQRILKARVDLIQALDLELDSNSMRWGRRLLRQALILGTGPEQSNEAMRIRRATLRLKGRPKDQKWDKVLFGLRMSELDLFVHTLEGSTTSTLGSGEEPSSRSLEARDAGMSLLLKDLESLEIEVAATYDEYCMLEIPCALFCAMQRGLIANTLASLSFSSLWRYQTLGWDDLRPCLLTCKNLQSLSMEQVMLVLIRYPRVEEPRRSSSQSMPNLRRLKVLDVPHRIVSWRSLWI